MASATPKGGRVEESKQSSSRREREFLRYAEAVFGLTGWENSESARSSRDVTLTAFAQLVALRLNARRSLIILYDKGYQYFLAEATRTLSLQQDEAHEPGDALFWGSAIVPHHKGLASQAMYVEEQLPEYVVEGAAVVYPDLTQMERWRDHKHVLEEPHVRSYAGVALLTPSGCPIGTLSIIDDKTRPGLLTPLEVKYMQDVATSIMSHLELVRTKAIYERGLKMVKGLSRFMEGETGQDEDQAMQGLSPPLSTDGAVAVPAPISPLPTKIPDPRPSYPLRPLAPVRKRSREVTPTIRRMANSLQQPTISSEQTALPSGLVSGEPQAIRERNGEDLVSRDIGQAFDRAAHIIQDSMDMAGVLFLGATAGTLGSLGSPTSHTSGSEGGASTTAGSDDALPIKTRAQPEVRMCKHLAAAYSPTVQDAPPFVDRGISEQFLKSLMRRFPNGRIWNFSDDELLSSDEHSDGSTGVERIKSTDYTPSIVGATANPAKRKRLRLDHERILEMFPGVRSFGIMPLWDSQRQRFFAGAIVWSYSTSRIFSMADEIHYLGAFCDVIMTEISKKDVQADARAKTTFISSITHELRSPLHGILGAVECLQETSEVSSGGQMLQMIDTCGRSLLDIINNLLDRAQTKPGKRVRADGTKKRKRRNGFKAASTQSVSNLAVLTEEVLDSALWLTPEPAPQSQTMKGQSSVPYSDEPLKIALAVDSGSDAVDISKWNFHIDAGAWRRIVQNLVANAIKYTDKGGFCKVSLAMVDGPPFEERPTSTVELTCSDSGRGMSKEYLANGLWQEFQQEESNVQGTGLGLSLVRNLVEDMGGVIDVQSTKWVGTMIRVSIPLQCGPREAETSLMEVSGVNGLTFGLFAFGLRGFDAPAGLNGREAEAMDVLRDSIIKLCQSMGINYINDSENNETKPDLWIFSERHALSTMEIDRLDGKQDLTPYLVLCNSSSSARALASTRAQSLDPAALLSQPLGPIKLRKAITSILTIATSKTLNTGGTSHPPLKKSHHLRLQSLPKPPTDLAALQKQQPSGTFSPLAVLLTDEKPIQTPSILLVDDNPVNLSLLQKSMEKIGRRHTSATNGLEAVEAYQKAVNLSPSPSSSEQPQPAVSSIRIIFMDITMPIMDGLEATRRIRAYERSMKLLPAKIAALTALASPLARQEAYASGIDLFLTKPVRFREIQEILAGWEDG